MLRSAKRAVAPHKNHRIPAMGTGWPAHVWEPASHRWDAGSADAGRSM